MRYRECFPFRGKSVRVRRPQCSRLSPSADARLVHLARRAQSLAGSCILPSAAVTVKSSPTRAFPFGGQPFLPITPDPARLGTYRSPCSKFSVRRTRPTSLQPPFGRGIPFSQPGRFLLTAVEQPKSTCPGSPQPSPARAPAGVNPFGPT